MQMLAMRILLWGGTTPVIGSPCSGAAQLVPLACAEQLRQACIWQGTVWDGIYCERYKSRPHCNLQAGHWIWVLQSCCAAC